MFGRSHLEGPFEPLAHGRGTVREGEKVAPPGRRNQAAGVDVRVAHRIGRKLEEARPRVLDIARQIAAQPAVRRFFKHSIADDRRDDAGHDRDD